MTVFAGAVLVITAGITAANLHTSQQTDGEKKCVQSPGRIPVVDFEGVESADEGKQELRKEKNKRYDGHGFVAPKSSPDITETVFKPSGGWYRDGLPVSQSTAILIGEVDRVDAYLSNDKTGVYTEIAILVTEVLMADGGRLLEAGSRLSADRPGGVVRYPGGHKRLYRIDGLGVPELGRRYVFFLANKESALNYNVVTAYELSPGGVIPVDLAAVSAPFKGMSETAFLNAVRSAIAQSRPETK
jgi:hypothetical protein